MMCHFETWTLPSRARPPMATQHQNDCHPLWLMLTWMHLSGSHPFQVHKSCLPCQYQYLITAWFVHSKKDTYSRIFYITVLIMVYNCYMAFPVRTGSISSTQEPPLIGRQSLDDELMPHLSDHTSGTLRRAKKSFVIKQNELYREYEEVCFVHHISILLFFIFQPCRGHLVLFTE